MREDTRYLALSYGSLVHPLEGDRLDRCTEAHSSKKTFFEHIFQWVPLVQCWTEFYLFIEEPWIPVQVLVGLDASVLPRLKS